MPTQITQCSYGLPRAVLFASACLLVASAHAQTTPASAAAEADEEMIILSPFEVRVERDKGYVAANTLAGSRLNTNLGDTPASISVMTKDFLRDIGAVNLNQAMEYALGGGNDIGGGASQVTATTGTGLINNDYNFIIRGYRSAQVTRNFFPTILGMDSFNLDRIDISRGPNAILFGVGGAGGVVNLSPKRARIDNTFTEVMVRTATWNKNRAAIDHNQTLLDGKAALRLNLMYQDADGYRDFESDDQKRGALAGTFRLTGSTTFRLDGELGELRQNRVRPWSAFDQISGWRDAGSFYFPYGAPETPGNTGNTQYTQAKVIGRDFERRSGNVGITAFFTDGPLAGTLLNMNPGQLPGVNGARGRYYRASHAAANVDAFNTPPNIEDENIHPRRANITGPGAHVDTDYHTIGAVLEQRIGQDLFIEGAINSSRVDRTNWMPMGFAQIALYVDAASTLPAFKADRSYDAVDASATQGPGALAFSRVIPNPYVGSLLTFYTPSYENRVTQQDDYRVSASYHLDLGWAGEHDLLAFGMRSETDAETQTLRETNVDPQRPFPNTYDNANNYNWRVSHLDLHSPNLADRGIPDPFTNPLPSGPYWGAPQYRFTPGYYHTQWSHVLTTIDSAAVAAHSKFWNKHIITTLGVRRDTIKQSDYASSTDSLGEAQRPTPRTTPPFKQSENTYTTGVVLRVPRYEWLNFYGNRSTNFAAQGESRLFDDTDNRTLIGPRRGRGSDYGIKLQLLDGRINLLAGKFKVVADHEATGFNSIIPVYINRIWDTIANNGPTGEVVNTHQPSGSDSRGRVSDGYEFEVVANPTKNWRLSFNYSKADNVVSGLLGAVSAYVEKHRAEWTSKAALSYDNTKPPGNLSNSGGFNTVGALIQGLDDVITIDKRGEGRAETNVRPVNANAFSAYSFTEGALKGFSIGGGVNYRGPEIEAVIVNPTTNESRTLKGHAYYLVNGMLSYERHLTSKINLRVQFNVDNLLNNQDKQVLAGGLTAARGPDGAAIPGADPILARYTYYFEPRHYSLTTTFSF